MTKLGVYWNMKYNLFRVPPTIFQIFQMSLTGKTK